MATFTFVAVQYFSIFDVYFVCIFVFRLELLLQMANKIQNMALDCEEKLTLAKNTLQAVSMGVSLSERSHKLFSKNY